MRNNHGNFSLPGLALTVLLSGLAMVSSSRAQSFVDTGYMPTATEYHTATLLTNGMVLVAGGDDGANNPLGMHNPQASGQLYNPATGKWTPTGSLTLSRYSHTATLLTNGQVLVAGGYCGLAYPSPVTSAAELFNPGTGSWTGTGPMHDARALQTSTLLADGRVLVIGGQNWTASLASMELFYPAAGAWTNTGPLNYARSGHTATLLPNGKVLIAGGYSNTAELYDPATGASASINPMNVVRSGHTATLLPGGRVLVAGGRNSGGNVSSAELYDPATGVWTLTGPLNTARSGHTATLLPDGFVMVTGGAYPSGGTELYNPSTGMWTPGGPLNTARYGQTATLLASGKLLIAGGKSGYFGALDSAELYDSGAGVWTPAGPLNHARLGQTSTLLPNGKVLVAGGNGSATFPPNPLQNAELFDPATGICSATGAMIDGRYSHTATVLQNGKVLVAGGAGSGGALTASEIYDPVAGAWAHAGSLNDARSGHTATLLPNGMVMVAGGAGPGGPLASAEIYDPSADAWSRAGSMISARAGHTAILLPNGQVLLTGGLGTGPGLFLTNAELFNPDGNTWTATTPMNAARYVHTATLLENGLVLVAGGSGLTGLVARAELYDPALKTWTPTGALKTPRQQHTATLQPNGQVLLTGGSGASGGVLGSAEFYNPASGSWSNAAAMVAPCKQQTATLMPNGRVLVAGGSGSAGLLDTTEIYDPYSSPAAGSWTLTGSLNSTRFGHTQTLLPDGRVLVAGGAVSSGSPPSLISSAEIFDPASKTWSAVGSLNTPRTAHTATLLPDGEVLVAGGSDGSGNPTASSELFDPGTGTWTACGSLNTPRKAHTATLLANGKVLVTGGDGLDFVTLASAELYDPIAHSWMPTGQLNTPRVDHTATLLPDGMVLVAGGMIGGFLHSTELYDPASEKWTFTGDMNFNRALHSAVLLPSGLVLVAAGNMPINYYDNSMPPAAAELYNPVTGKWTITGALNAGTYRNGVQQAILLPNGSVLLALSGPSEVYDPATGIWTYTGPLNAQRRNGFTMSLLLDGRLLVAGGLDNGLNALAGCELYDTGLGFSPAQQPQVASVTSPLNFGASLTLSGSQFRGNSEGSSGDSQDSPADYPLVQLRSLEGGVTVFVPSSNWSAGSVVCEPLAAFPPGWALATVFVNGVPGSGSVVSVSPPAGVPTALLNSGMLSDGSFQTGFTNTPGAWFNMLAATNLSLPLSNWTILGGVTEISPGQFQFTDPQATNSVQRFYKLLSP